MQIEPLQPATTLPDITQPEPTQPINVEEQVKIIREWYSEIENDPNLTSKVYGTSAEVFWKDGQVVIIKEFHQLNDAMDPAYETVRFYYRDGVPFFIYITYENCQYPYQEVRLYYMDGQLIRWVLDQEKPNDNVPTSQWDKYYQDAWDSLESLPE
jgi:hypothetical protein